LLGVLALSSSSSIESVLNFLIIKVHDTLVLFELAIKVDFLSPDPKAED
jgi:hypothetical protein